MAADYISPPTEYRMIATRSSGRRQAAREIDFVISPLLYRPLFPEPVPNGASEVHGSGPHPVLSDINLKVPAGLRSLSSAPTGCGKTTLADLIARLWEAPMTVS